MEAVVAILLVVACTISGPTGTGRAESAPPAETHASDTQSGDPPADGASLPTPGLRDSAVAAPSSIPSRADTTAVAASAGPDSTAGALAREGASAAAPAPEMRATAHRKPRPAWPVHARSRSLPPAEAVVEGAADAPSGSSNEASNAESGGSEANRVAREIARTAMWLARATSVVPHSQNAKAADILASAEDLQLGARDAYEVQQYARAQRLTQSARDYSERAIRLAGPATDDPEYVRTVLAHTDDALDRLKDYLDTGGTTADKRRYRRLKDDQKDARQLLDGGNPRAAYKATTRVRDGVLDLLRHAPVGEVPCGSAKKAVENAKGSRDRVRKDIGPHPTAATARYLSSADQQLARARALLERQSCRDAVLRAKAAERQLERAIDASRQTRKGKK
jgi:hypothetical protein